MASSADSGTVTAIETELTALSVPASLHGPLLLAVDKAGYEVVPQGGGSPVAVADALDATFAPVEGIPGLAVVGVTLPDTTVVYRLATANDLARSPRTPSVPVPVTSLAAATPASLGAIGVEMDILRQPPSLLLTLMQAIDDAGFNLSAKTSGAAVTSGTALTVEIFSVLGFPGMVMVSVTMPDASVLSRIIADRELIGENVAPGIV